MSLMACQMKMTFLYRICASQCQIAVYEHSSPWTVSFIYECQPKSVCSAFYHCNLDIFSLCSSTFYAQIQSLQKIKHKTANDLIACLYYCVASTIKMLIMKLIPVVDQHGSLMLPLNSACCEFLKFKKKSHFCFFCPRGSLTSQQILNCVKADI